MTTDPAHDAETPVTKPPRLIVSAAVALVAVVVALVFGSAHATVGGGADGQNNTRTIQQTSGLHHDTNKAVHDEPQYYNGGLWSPGLGIAGLADAAVLSAAPLADVTCQSLAWHDGRLVVTDVSPIRIASVADDAFQLVMLSVDHAGGDIPVEFAVALQNHITQLGEEPDAIWILPPLPGPDTRPTNQDPYDWTYLATTEDVGLHDWSQILGEEWTEKRPSPADAVSAWHAWFVRAERDGGLYKPTDTTDALINRLLSDEPTASADARWLLRRRGPYEVIPRLHAWLDKGINDRRVYEAIMLCRAMHISADALVDDAAASDNPALRALAARSIGDLAGLTADPIGKLTPLAEDGDMRVRYEALVACRAMPGRRAAGVAQLVEPYAMDENMRALYTDTMTMMASYGEPVPADSRADRLRRMPINELLDQDRDAIVCTILLERADLPDDKIDEVLGQLATTTETKPLSALLSLLEAMNPRMLDKRDALLKKLVDWETKELEAQGHRLDEMAKTDGKPNLRRAAAAALIRSTPNYLGVIESIGLNSVVFEGLGWLKQTEIPKGWIEFTIEVALTAPDEQEGKIAALDAIKLLPTSAIKPDTVNGLLSLARASDNLDLRFAAIRALNALPADQQPGGIDDLRLTSLTLHTLPGQMKYDQQALTAVAARPVELTLINPDNMEHNLVITRPGRLQEVGLATATMTPTNAAAIGYVPETDAVLYATAMIRPGGRETLRFIAPAAPGDYPFVCTYPGHWMTMNGVIKVVAP